MSFLLSSNKFFQVIYLFGTFLFLIIYASSALSALPTGYKEDFNGCSTEQDTAKRNLCCDSVAEDCNTVCDSNLNAGEIGPGGFISCGWDCTDANSSCKDGNKVKVGVEWPGHEAIIPGLFYDEHKIVIDRGASIGISSDTVVIEVESDNKNPKLSTCMSLVTHCDCPQAYGDAGNSTCEPKLTSGAIQCSICTLKGGSKYCEICPECTPVINSVQMCSKDLRHNSEKLVK